LNKLLKNYLVAIRMAMIKRFGQSPTYVKDKYVIGVKEFSKPEEETQTIIHCTHYAEPRFFLGGWINISPKTYLKGNGADDRLSLLQAIGVPIAPEKHLYNGHHESLQFSLLFKGLPSSWSSFSFIEEAEEGDQFIINDIPRNDIGVYKIRL